MVAWVCVAGCLSSHAAPFDCGSSGSYGAMNISSDTTLQVPPDGIFHCTTINVSSNATLSFSGNALNTPVYLLATGDVIIDGSIDVSANGPASIRSFNGTRPNKAGPGGFDGGYGGMYYNQLTTGGDGYGPGAGKHTPESPAATQGEFGTGANAYGNLLLVPLIGGSGGTGVDGTPGMPGGGGGGAVLIASNTKIINNGRVAALGGDTYDRDRYFAGSGGGIRVVAPTVTGSGTLTAQGGMGYGWFGNTQASHGRIRIDCTDFLAWRSLNLVGRASRGNRMFVFPAVIPRLDILEVASQAIPEGTNSPAVFELAPGTSSNQTVRVQARNFTNDIPIRVVVTPENGPSGSFDATILQSSGSPPFAIVPVVLPAGSVCQIHVWKR